MTDKLYQVGKDQLTKEQIFTRQFMAKALLDYWQAKVGCCGNYDTHRRRIVAYSYQELTDEYLKVFGTLPSV